MSTSGYNLFIADDRNVSQNKKLYGFAGYLAQLTYYNYALNPKDIISLYNYYKDTLNTMQRAIDKKAEYVLPPLITNSDVYIDK